MMTTSSKRWSFKKIKIKKEGSDGRSWGSRSNLRPDGVQEMMVDAGYKAIDDDVIVKKLRSLQY